MKLRAFCEDTDFEMIRTWIADERAHAMWCANRFQYPLERGNFMEVLSEIAKRNGDFPCVATMDDDKPVGFFCYATDRDNQKGKFKFVIVDPECRGNGIAKEMFHLALTHAFDDAGAETAQLVVFSENTRAKKFYEKVGFAEERTDPQAFAFQDELWDRCFMTIHKMAML